MLGQGRAIRVRVRVSIRRIDKVVSSCGALMVYAVPG